MEFNEEPRGFFVWIFCFNTERYSVWQFFCNFLDDSWFEKNSQIAVLKFGRLFQSTDIADFNVRLEFLSVVYVLEKDQLLEMRSNEFQLKPLDQRNNSLGWKIAVVIPRTKTKA